jgi:hypothetical protein
LHIWVETSPKCNKQATSNILSHLYQLI